MDNFQAFNLPEALLHKLEHLGFTKPTPIQAKAIPIALQGKDILGSAQTGTGKTAAFGIPAITNLLSNKNAQALIITPTRELATQVHKALSDMLAKNNKVGSVLLIGGEPIGKQLNRLKSNPRLIIATPGRLNDHLRGKSINLSNVNYLVLDETDRMLDMGFSVQIDEIVKHIPQQRQTLLFSATLPKNIIDLSKKYLTNPERIAVGDTHKPSQNITQENIKIADADKFAELTKQVDARSGSVIVFVKTKYATERIAKRLKAAKHEAAAIHGDLRHNKREQVTKAFRQQKYRILVATDIAARGLDIPHIEHVINYDLPQCAEDFIHRIGRTGRAGKKGEAVNFIAPSDKAKWAAIERLLDPSLKPEKPQGNKAKSRRSGKRYGSKAKPARPSKGKPSFNDRKRKFGKTDKPKKAKR